SLECAGSALPLIWNQAGGVITVLFAEIGGAASPPQRGDGALVFGRSQSKAASDWCRSGDGRHQPIPGDHLRPKGIWLPPHSKGR
ncbi:hypothetical protein, partial [Candidatus Thiosymbion oneisti]|uniref:hypothetical protein n=1 Tax=Candidatus Thiosymbion oneisti TaxID=589554 RepID=UPI001C4025DC